MSAADFKRLSKGERKAFMLKIARRANALQFELASNPPKNVKRKSA